MVDVGSASARELEKFAAQAGEWWNLAGPFKTLHEINPLRLEYIAARANLAGARVLDVGCGGGILSEALAREGAAVLGTDLAPANIEAAREHCAEAGLAIEYGVVDVVDLAAQRPGSFDVVTCLEMLEHVPEPERIVKACADLARPGGAVFFSTLNRNLKSFLLAIVGAEYLLGLLPRGTHGYAGFIRPAELAAACRAAGLDLLDITGLHFSPFDGRHWLGGNVAVNYLTHAVRRDHR